MGDASASAEFRVPVIASGTIITVAAHASAVGLTPVVTFLAEAGVAEAAAF